MTGTESLLKELSVEYGQVIIGGENLLKYLQQEYGSISIPNNSNRFIGDINTENEIYKTKVENVVTIPVPKYSNSYVNELKTVDSGKNSLRINSSYLDIKNKQDFEQYIVKVKNVDKFKNFFSKQHVTGVDNALLVELHKKYSSNYDIIIKKYLKGVDNIKCPEEFDDDTNYDIVMEICKLITKHFINNILTACYNGGSHSGTYEGESKYCKEYESVIEQYLQSIYARKFSRIKEEDSIKGNEKFFQTLGSPDACIINKIEVYPHSMRYIDENGRITSNIIEGKASFRR